MVTIVMWVVARQFRRIPQGINRPLTMADNSIPVCVLVEPISQMGDHGHIVAFACQARLQGAHRRDAWQVIHQATDQ
jgi:hypothetical protein